MCQCFSTSSSAPNLSERQKCYAARDAFFECVAKCNEGGTPTNDCDKLKEVYQSSCRPAWVGFALGAYHTLHYKALGYSHTMIKKVMSDLIQVKYFDKKRVYDEYKKKLEEKGYQPLPSESEDTKR